MGWGVSSGNRPAEQVAKCPFSAPKPLGKSSQRKHGNPQGLEDVGQASVEETTTERKALQNKKRSFDKRRKEFLNRLAAEVHSTKSAAASTRGRLDHYWI